MITLIGDLAADILVSAHETNYATDADADIHTVPGGQANNVAAWVGATDYPAMLIGNIGNDMYGNFLLEALEPWNIQSFITKDNSAETGKIVIYTDSQTGERTMHTDRGANKQLSVTTVQRAEDTIKSSDLLYISGYSLFEKTTHEAVSYAKHIARIHHVPIAFDPSSTYFLQKHHGLVRSFINEIDLFFPNLDEARYLTGKMDPGEVMKDLLSLVKYPVLKMGSSGSLIHDRGDYIHIPAKNVPAIDTTGAGDAYIGTFLPVYIQSANLIYAAQSATEKAAACIQQTGARPQEAKK